MRDIVCSHGAVEERHVQRQSGLFLMLDLGKADCAAIRARVRAVDVFLAKPSDEALAVEGVIAMRPDDGLVGGGVVLKADGT